MRRHPFDAISFVFGVIFILVAAAVALPETPLELLFQRVRWGWIFPTAIIAIGIALLVPVLRPRDEPGEPPGEAPGAQAE